MGPPIIRNITSQSTMQDDLLVLIIAMSMLSSAVIFACCYNWLITQRDRDDNRSACEILKTQCINFWRRCCTEEPPRRFAVDETTRLLPRGINE